MGAYRARPAGARAKGAVIVAHQLFGVTPDITGIADRLAGLGYLAIAPDFYHRSEPDVALEATGEGRARGFELLGEVTRATVRDDVQATLSWLRDHRAGRTAMVGVSVGGHLAYYAATRFPFAATVALYPTFLTGTELPLGRPEPTLDLTAGISGRLLMIVGDQDHIITAEQRHAIAARLAADGVRHEIRTLQGASHAFLNPHTPSYDKAATEESWRHIEKALTDAVK